MPTPKKGPRHGGSPAHQRLMMANLATALFEHGRITTTEARARTLRPFAEKLITKAKRGDLHNRREVLKTIRDKSVVHELFTEIAPSFADRPGGYTRITKLGPRKGDNAPMAVIELVTEAYQPKTRATRTEQAAAEEPEVADDAVEAKAEEADVAAFADVDGADDALAEETEGGVEGKYAGSHAPLESDEAPDGFPIKGNEDSMKYHEPDSQWYEQTVAEVWFDTVESAEAAGFTKAGE